MPMDAWLTSPVLVVLIVMAGIIVLTWIFRGQLGRLIDRAVRLRASVNKEGASLDVGAAAASNPVAASQVIVPPNAPRTRLIDPRLQYIAPPLDPAQFQTVYMPTGGKIGVYGWPLAPMGTVMIHSVPFYFAPHVEAPGRLLGHKAIDLRPAEGNSPNRTDLSVDATGVKAVHFVLAAGNGWTRWKEVQYLNKRIGYIELRSVAGATQRVDLVLGKNIREWAFGTDANTVREADFDLVKPAWVSEDNRRRLDLLTVAIEHGPIDLECISIVAVFQDQVEFTHDELPAIIVSSITCERVV